METAKIIEELDEVARDLWNAGKLNAQARTLERIAAALATQPAEQASAGSLPTNDKVYAEVCRERGKSTFYVSTNAVNDVMQAVRKLAAPLAPSDTHGAEGLLEYARVREEFQIVAGLGATADMGSAMMVVNALLRAALAQQAPDAVRDASGLISATEILISHCEREYPGAHMTPALLEARSAVARAKLAEHNKGE